MVELEMNKVYFYAECRSAERQTNLKTRQFGPARKTCAVFLQ